MNYALISLDLEGGVTPEQRIDFEVALPPEWEKEESITTTWTVPVEHDGALGSAHAKVIKDELWEAILVASRKAGFRGIQRAVAAIHVGATKPTTYRKPRGVLRGLLEG